VGAEPGSSCVYKCRGSFETSTAVVNVSVENCTSQPAFVNGSVRIEPLRQVRPSDDYYRRRALKAEIRARHELQQRRAREAADCAAREQQLRTTLLELQQAVGIAEQELAKNEESLALACDVSVSLSDELLELKRRYRTLCAHGPEPPVPKSPATFRQETAPETAQETAPGSPATSAG